MTGRKNNKLIDPVVIVSMGIFMIAIAIWMLLFQPRSDSSRVADPSGSFGQLALAFITGLTTGGLSCLAVQGGLLASSLANQIEQDYLQEAVTSKGKRQNKPAARNNSAVSIILFLVAKLLAYTLLGGLLGWLGSYLGLSPGTRAVLMIAIGVFMMGNALRIYNVHPVFRYFSIEAPRFVTRAIRRKAKGTDAFTPLFLGVMTIFIPCGVTQAMMAAALGTGNGLMGAALMFAFTLGTSPVFFIVAYLTTELGTRLERYFMRFVALVLLILGMMTINNGLNIVGSPLSYQNLVLRWFPSDDEISILASVDRTASSSAASQSIVPEDQLFLNVVNYGYFPRTLRAPADRQLTLNLITDGTYSCARDFVIPALRYYELLPDRGVVQVSIPPQQSGSVMFFTCSMGMYTGQIIFE